MAYLLRIQAPKKKSIRRIELFCNYDAKIVQYSAWGISWDISTVYFHNFYYSFQHAWIGSYRTKLLCRCEWNSVLFLFFGYLLERREATADEAGTHITLSNW
ncbi:MULTISPECIES: hypothetical protein [unclassified Bartonella]|uniref:hypothetical protein n=1 Tax=Bartonella TaxID=773 RepID=UPI0035CFD841